MEKINAITTKFQLTRLFRRLGVPFYRVRRMVDNTMKYLRPYQHNKKIMTHETFNQESEVKAQAEKPAQNTKPK